MTQQTDRLGYDTKSTEYFQVARAEMLRFVPANCRRVLDVGCAEGAFGESLKKTLGIEVWGVEPTKSAAAKAMPKLDRVIEGDFGPEVDLPVGTFDCIFFNDVLEHMLAPEKALRHARSLLAPGGVVVASIPNIRYFPVVYQLMIHARWEYVDSGILDRTHLRFFTRSSIVNMFEREGFVIDTIAGINVYSGPSNARRLLWWAFRLANILALRRFDDMRFLRFAVVAKPMIGLVEGDSATNR
ncbi:MAG: class I SAM-dependent methyltransferase [Formivibrio sp.]|nr:class I SAM-dependent methyltransferase [Formivibrio sp.]